MRLPELAHPTLVEALKQANPTERRQIVEALRTLRLLLDETGGAGLLACLL